MNACLFVCVCVCVCVCVYVCVFSRLLSGCLDWRLAVARAARQRATGWVQYYVVRPVAALGRGSHNPPLTAARKGVVPWAVRSGASTCFGFDR